MDSYAGLQRSTNQYQRLGTLAQYMQIAHNYGHQHIVVQALGIDVFGVDIDEVAKWWLKYRQSFPSIEIVFAHKRITNSLQQPLLTNFIGAPRSTRAIYMRFCQIRDKTRSVITIYYLTKIDANACSRGSNRLCSSLDIGPGLP